MPNIFMFVYKKKTGYGSNPTLKGKLFIWKFWSIRSSVLGIAVFTLKTLLSCFLFCYALSFRETGKTWERLPPRDLNVNLNLYSSSFFKLQK